MHLKKWNKFFEKTSVETDESEEKTYDDLRDGVSRLIKMQLRKTDFTSRKELALAYLRDEDKNPIEGFINDSDIYEFYLKYRDDIDDLLSQMRWFDETPSENNIFSIYDFIIVSTKKAFREIIGVMVK